MCSSGWGEKLMVSCMRDAGVMDGDKGKWETSAGYANAGLRGQVGGGTLEASWRDVGNVFCEKDDGLEGRVRSS